MKADHERWLKTATAEEVEARKKHEENIRKLVAEGVEKIKAERAAILDAGAAEALTSASFSADELLAASAPAPEVIEGLLFEREVHALIAEGGLGKTTVMVAALVDYVLGRRVLEMWEAVEPRGRVLIVSSEDRRAQLLRTLRKVVAATTPEGEMAATADRLAASVSIFDCSGEVTALHAWYREESVWVWSPFAERLAALIKATAARIVVLDPVGMFFGGEENSNDYGQRFMKDLRSKIADECGCAVLAVHHVSKAVARDGTSDQHVGRGASALAGNARGVMHMAPLRKRAETVHERTWAAPESVTDADLAEGRAFVLHQHKYSYAPTWDGPVVILRRGFSFRVRAMEQHSAADHRVEETAARDLAMLRFLNDPARQFPMPRDEAISMRESYLDKRQAHGRDAALASFARLREAGLVTVKKAEKGRIDIVAVAKPPDAGRF